MKGFLIVAGIIGFFYLIGWLYNLFEKHREKIREQVANEVFNGIDIESYVDKYQAKLLQIDYVRPESKEVSLYHSNTPQWAKSNLLMQECPKCTKGRIIPRRGKYGMFLGCSRYPNCVYTNNGKQQKQDNKESINSQVIDDINKAYSGL